MGAFADHRPPLGGTCGATAGAEGAVVADAEAEALASSAASRALLAASSLPRMWRLDDGLASGGGFFQAPSETKYQADTAATATATIHGHRGAFRGIVLAAGGS